MRRPALGILIVVLATACQRPAPPPSVTPAPAPAPVPEPTAKAVPLPPGMPDTPAGRQIAWVLEVLAEGAKGLDADAVKAHFHPSFLASVPSTQVRSVLGTVATQFTEIAFASVETKGEILVARVKAKPTGLVLHLAVDPPTGQIASFVIRPEPGPKPSSFDEAKAMVEKLAPRAQLLVAELDRGVCVPIHAVDADALLAIGSTFKLYVLLALAERIGAGKLAWDGTVAVRDAWKSLPSGITQNDPAGTALTIRTLAERMISISDNTATDHLLYTVGRERVEATLRATRHRRPELDVPFLSTREVFLLKGSVGDEAVGRYLAMKPRARRTYLDQTLAGQAPAIEHFADWKEPRRIDTLEWFAGGNDLCKAMAGLQRIGARPPTAAALEILAKNPGIEVDPSVWPYVGFKGGSEPGVFNATWLVRRDDARWFVIAIGLNAPAGPAIVVTDVLGLASGLLELLAGFGR